MKIREILKKFETLSDSVLSDGKVDWEETNELLEFMEPYVKAGNWRFAGLKELVVKCREDGRITDDESKQMAEQILKVKRFLKVETALMIAYVTLVYGAAVIGVGMFIAQKMMEG